MFIQIAKQGKNGFWLYFATVLLVIVGYFLGSAPLLIVMTAAIAAGNATQEDVQSMNFEAMGIDLNLALALNLIPFMTGLFALWIGISRIHGRPFKTLISAHRQIDYGKIFFAAGLWFVFNVLAESTMYLMQPELYVWQFNPNSFFILLLISLLLLPLQTSFEELFLRGYLLQGIGIAVPYRWVTLVITSVIFGLLHIANPEVSKFGIEIMMVYYIGFGIAAAVFTLMDDSTELAIGLHWANNFFGAVCVSFQGSALQTESLWKVSEINPYLMLAYWIPMVTIFGLIMAKKYGWQQWGARLFGKGVSA